MNGDPGPLSEDLRDLLLVDHPAGFTLAGLLDGTIAQQPALLVPEVGGPLVVLPGDRVLLVLAQGGELLVDRGYLGHIAGAMDALTATRLIDEVDRLVGKEAVGEVAIGQVGRRDDGLVGEAHRVVGLVAVLETHQDLDGLADRRLVDLDRLEPALEGGVLLQVLAVLLEGRGADRLQLTSGEHRLEDRGGVDGAFGRSGAHQGVDLVDEEDDVAPALDLFEHLLQTLLEVAPIAGAGDEGAEVERIEVLALEIVRDFLGDDALGETLDDGGLPHTGLTDQHRVVLGPAREDLHHTLDLADPADDRVQLPFPCQLGVVPPELIEDGRTARRPTRVPRSRLARMTAARYRPARRAAG